MKSMAHFQTRGANFGKEERCADRDEAELISIDLYIEMFI
jgi:hypothetical protein